MRCIAIVVFFFIATQVPLVCQSYFSVISNIDYGFESASSLFEHNGELVTIGASATDHEFVGKLRMRFFETNTGEPTSDLFFLDETSGSYQLDKSIKVGNLVYSVGVINRGGGLDNLDILVCCFSLSAELLWYKVLGDADRFERAYDIALSGDMALVISSVQATIVGGSRTHTLINKLSLGGELIWGSIVSGKDADYFPSSVAVDSAGYVYVLADSESFIPTVEEMSVSKLNPEGVLLWTKYYPRDRFSTGNQILITEEQRLLIAGDARLDEYDGAASYFYMSLDTSGVELWTQDYFEYVGGRSYHSNMIFTNENQIARVYAVDGHPTLLVTDMDGSVSKQRTYFAIDDFFSKDLLELEDGSFVILGNIPFNNVLNPDINTIWLLRTDPEGYLVSVEDFMQDELLDIDIFPNPTATTITVGDPEVLADKVRINVSDFLGNILIVSEDRTIDVSQLPNGTYIVSLFVQEIFLGADRFVKF